MWVIPVWSSNRVYLLWAKCYCYYFWLHGEMVFRVFHNTSKRRYWKQNFLFLQCYSVHLHNQYIKYFFPENEKHQITILYSVFQNYSLIPEYKIPILFSTLLSESQCLWCFHLSFAWFCHKYRKMTFTRLKGYKSCGSIFLPGLHKTYLGQGTLFQLSIP